MLHIEHTYPKKCKGPCKSTRFHAEFIKNGQSTWHKKQFKHLWLKFMIWNRNALREENGVSTNTSSIAFKRFLGKNRRTLKFQHLHNV